MADKREVKQQYRQLIQDNTEKPRPLHYTVALSSGLNVTQEIPDEAYKRAAWASNQGASFIELSIGGPSQIYNEWDNLLSISRQLGLSFDCHFPVKVPFDYANPYREQREEIGFYYSHEFMYEFIEAWGEFKDALESQEDVNGRQQHVWGINSHLVKSTIPERAERMAGSVSVDPWGEDIMESRIFANKTFRVGFFQHYLWEEELKDNFDTLQSIANEIEGFRDFQVRAREVFTDYMEEHGYINDDLLEAVSNIGDLEKIRETYEYKIENDVPLNLQSQTVEAMRSSVVQSRVQERFNPDEYDQEEQEEARQELQRIEQEEQVKVEDAGENELFQMLPEETDDDSDVMDQDAIIAQEMRSPMNADSAMRNIAGTDADVPESVDKLRQHREGSSIAQSIPRFDPELYENARWANLIPVEVLKRSEDEVLTETADFQEAQDQMYENLKDEIRKGVIDRLEQEEPYQGARPYMQDTDRGMSKGEVAFRDIINFRGGYFQDQMSRESVIYWYILPWWMPFSGNEHLEYIWSSITKLDADDYSFEDWEQFRDDLEELKDSEHYDWIHAAGAGAYVWGHFTQFIGPGQEMTLVEMLDRFDLTLDWESHNVGNQGNGKCWKPHDIIRICRAINNTPVNGETHDVLRCTIDMEHMAMNGYDPLWLIEGNEDKDLRGLDDGDGHLIQKQHVTHPALSETGHHHQPIRRGDTVVYEHIEALVDKGFCQNPDRPAIVMHELGAEKAESTFMLRLMLNMLETGIRSDTLKDEVVDDAMTRYDSDGDVDLEDYLVLKFFGLTDEEWHHEWQEISEHALEPLDDLLDSSGGEHTWSGQGVLEQGEGNRPEDEQRERYQ